MIRCILFVIRCEYISDARIYECQEVKFVTVLQTVHKLFKKRKTLFGVSVQRLLGHSVEQPITFYLQCEGPFLRPHLLPEWQQQQEIISKIINAVLIKTNPRVALVTNSRLQNKTLDRTLKISTFSVMFRGTEPCRKCRNLGGRGVCSILTGVKPQRASVRKRCHLIPLKAELNPICHLLALLGVHHIFHVSELRVNFAKKKHLIIFLQTHWNYKTIQLALLGAHHIFIVGGLRVKFAKKSI